MDSWEKKENMNYLGARVFPLAHFALWLKISVIVVYVR